MISPLAQLATGRKESLFAADLASHGDQLRQAVAGRRLLVIGGAGSIGSATVDLVSGLDPACLHVIDQSENYLAELVRHLRSRPGGLAVKDARFLPLDFGSRAACFWLQDQPAYDAVLHFAALKHVRSEKDSYSLWQMLDTNVIKLLDLMEHLSQVDFKGRFFSVSTDKAANPVNMMGASKRLMEHIIYNIEAGLPCLPHASSARFANVAFSNGSLLQSFQERLSQRQPLASPSQIQRFFVSLEESAHICALAAFLVDDQITVAPRVDQGLFLVSLEEVARKFLRHHGLEPAIYDQEAAAIQALEGDLAQGRYPLLLTPPDTMGEKLFEEFVGQGEETRELGFSALVGVPHQPAPAGALPGLVARLRQMLGAPRVFGKQDLVELMGQLFPQFQHAETGKSLDERM